MSQINTTGSVQGLRLAAAQAALAEKGGKAQSLN